jgi:hypothetical protein
MATLSDVAILVTVIMGVVTMLTIMLKSRRETKNIVRNEIRLFFETREAQRLIENAVDNSQVSRKLDRLIIILCTNDEHLKHSRLCEGE